MNKEIIRRVASKLDESQKAELAEAFGWLKKHLESVPSIDKQDEWVDRGLKWLARETKIKFKKPQIVDGESSRTLTAKVKVSDSDEECFLMISIHYQNAMVTINFQDGDGHVFSVVGETNNRFYTANAFDQAISKMNAWLKSKGLK